MDRVQNLSDSECYTALSETFGYHHINLVNKLCEEYRLLDVTP
jgi:hypothetical protein